MAFNRQFFKEAYKAGYKKALKESLKEEPDNLDGVRDVLTKLMTKGYFYLIEGISYSRKASHYMQYCKFVIDNDKIVVYSLQSPKVIDEFSLDDIIGGWIKETSFRVKLSNSNVYEMNVYELLRLSEI